MNAQTKIVGTVRPIPLRYMTVRSKHNEIYILIFYSYIIAKNGPSRTPVPTVFGWCGYSKLPAKSQFVKVRSATKRRNICIK